MVLVFLKCRVDVRGDSGSAGIRSPPTFLLLPDLDIQLKNSSGVLFISDYYGITIGKRYLLHVAYGPWELNAHRDSEARKRSGGLGRERQSPYDCTWRGQELWPRQPGLSPEGVGGEEGRDCRRYRIHHLILPERDTQQPSTRECRVETYLIGGSLLDGRSER